MSVQETPAMMELSKQVFGQQHRLAIMIEIARAIEGLINPSDLAESLGYRAQSTLQAPMRDLEHAGLITRLPPGESRSKTWYMRNASLAWDWVRELADSLERSDARSP